jgi:hypothetical protein
MHAIKFLTVNLIGVDERSIGRHGRECVSSPDMSGALTCPIPGTGAQISGSRRACTCYTNANAVEYESFGGLLCSGRYVWPFCVQPMRDEFPDGLH